MLIRVHQRFEKESTNLLLVSDAADTTVNPSETVPDIRMRLFECKLGGTIRAVLCDGSS